MWKAMQKPVIVAALAADYFVTPVLLHRFRPFGDEKPAAQMQKGHDLEPLF
jgi:hypothetical protein